MRKHVADIGSGPEECALLMGASAAPFQLTSGKCGNKKAQRIYSAASLRVHVMQRSAPLNQVSHVTQSEKAGAHLKKRFELELMDMKNIQMFGQ